MSHYPVMLPEVLQYLAPADEGVYVDGTFGAGGYTAAILDQADCTVIAIDRDETAFARAQALKEKYGERLVFLRGCFGDVEALLEGAGYGRVDGFVLDLGVSSMQLDRPERGFSFRFDGPLDMRMSQGAGGQTAADLVNDTGEKELADIIYRYGEERHSRRIASKIVERRKSEKFTRTADLADLVRSVLPKSRKDDSDPATRTFQALRIAVNDELGELERALAAAANILKPDGRLVVVSFHSLEDRIVKNYLRDRSGKAPKGSRYMPEVKGREAPLFSDVSKALKPSAQELSANPRSRSARLRAARRMEAGI